MQDKPEGETTLTQSRGLTKSEMLEY